MDGLNYLEGLYVVGPEGNKPAIVKTLASVSVKLCMQPFNQSLKEGLLLGSCLTPTFVSLFKGWDGF